MEYNQILFVDSMRGYVATSSGSVLVTTDAGNDWIEKQFSPHSLLSISASGDSLVWAAGGKVYRSRDGGSNWEPSPVSGSYGLFGVYFVDSVRGWALGEGSGGDGINTVFHSSDGAFSWELQRTISCLYFCYMRKGYFVDTLHGWIAGKYAIDKTVDGGRTWGYGSTADLMQDVFFLDTLRGWSVGLYSNIYRTTDGGMTWIRTYMYAGGGDARWRSVFFVDSLTGWVCSGYGGILCSTDGGRTWSWQLPNSTENFGLNSIFFTNKLNGWAVGKGRILHTTNGGVAFTSREEQSPVEFSLSQNYPNPFNPTTHFQFSVSELSVVKLQIYDILGRQVATLLNEQKFPGRYEVEWNASASPSGVYICQLTCTSNLTSFQSSKRMLLVK